MDYRTFLPHPDLESLVKCYWTLDVPAEPASAKQRILPDGCIEMFFILGDDVKRYTSEDAFVLQPRAMVLGQITEPLFIQPTGMVKTFAARFYPYGFANFTAVPMNDLANKETPLTVLFEERDALQLERDIVAAAGTPERISILNGFLLQKLKDKHVIAGILRSTIDAILSTKGSVPISLILKEAASKRRQLERSFSKQVGVSPKQLGKIIRLQAALKMMLDAHAENLTSIAYEREYYDQSHFIKDFKEFTGVSPKEFYKDDALMLSLLISRKD